MDSTPSATSVRIRPESTEKSTGYLEALCAKKRPAISPSVRGSISHRRIGPAGSRRRSAGTASALSRTFRRRKRESTATRLSGPVSAKRPPEAPQPMAVMFYTLGWRPCPDSGSRPPVGPMQLLRQWANSTAPIVPEDPRVSGPS
jgi:hypothetical protein